MGFGSAHPDPAQLAACERVAALARQRFRLADADAVLVSELACSQPGCPPLETVIAFWGAEARRHHWKVFKPVQQVLEDDLPPWWMKDALAVPPDFACDCC